MNLPNLNAALTVYAASPTAENREAIRVACSIDVPAALGAPVAQAQQSVPTDWLIVDSLLYRLNEYDVNCDEINVTMAGGSRKEAPRAERAKQLLAMLAARAAAPVSGQGASIDTPEFRDLLYACYAETHGHKAQDALVQFIDSRPRSEDSRAKVLEAAELCEAEAAKTRVKAAENNSRASDMAFGRMSAAEDLAAAIRALASTTPPKADNE